MFKQVERLVGASSAWIEANSYFHQSLLKCLSSAAPSHFLFLKKVWKQKKEDQYVLYLVALVWGSTFFRYLLYRIFGRSFSVYRFRSIVFDEDNTACTARHGTARQRLPRSCAARSLGRRGCSSFQNSHRDVSRRSVSFFRYRTSFAAQCGARRTSSRLQPLMFSPCSAALCSLCSQHLFEHG